ncbi:hypothetical protein MMC17_008602 [Xylographa soralifera]|nr:hypothetical protein [Xylographa soralifera]
MPFQLRSGRTNPLYTDSSSQTLEATNSVHIKREESGDEEFGLAHISTRKQVDIGDNGDGPRLPFCDTRLGRLPIELRHMIYKYALPVPLSSFNSEGVRSPIYHFLMSFEMPQVPIKMGIILCHKEHHSGFWQYAGWVTQRLEAGQESCLKLHATCQKLYKEAFDSLRGRCITYLKDVSRLVYFVYRTGQAQGLGCICEIRRREIRPSDIYLRNPSSCIRDLISAFLEKHHKDSWNQLIGARSEPNFISNDRISAFHRLHNELQRYCVESFGRSVYGHGFMTTETFTLGVEIANKMNESERWAQDQGWFETVLPLVRFDMLPPASLRLATRSAWSVLEPPTNFGAAQFSLFLRGL